MNRLDSIERTQLRTNIPEFQPGDTVRVHVRIKESETKERLQAFEGVVIARKHGGARETITVRKTSFGVGVGIKNFQASGGNDRGYNGVLLGTGPDLGKMEISRFDGGAQQPAAAANAISIGAGNIIDCSLTRSGWTMTATASHKTRFRTASRRVSLASEATMGIAAIGLGLRAFKAGTIRLRG